MADKVIAPPQLVTKIEAGDNITIKWTGPRPGTGKVRISSSGGSSLLEELKSDPVSPSQGQLWILYTPASAGTGAGEYMGFGAFTYVGSGSTPSKFELSAMTSDGIKRAEIT